MASDAAAFACAVAREVPGFRLDVALSAEPGETLALFGASGSGKSMTLNLAAGAFRPDRGRIVIGGEVVFDRAAGVDLPVQARRVGYVPQHYALFPHLSVADNIAFGLGGLSRTEREQTVAELLTRLRLEGLAGRLPRQLSGGQQQRTALARALAIRPRLLLLDEPFAALDAGLRVELREEQALLRRDFPITTLLVTHDLSDVHALADRVALYSDGKVIQIGPCDEVFRRPVSVEAARLTGARNLLPANFKPAVSGLAAVVAGGHIFACDAAAPPAAGAAITLALRPEHVRVLPPGAVPEEDESAASGVVERTLPQGTATAVWVRLANGGPLIEATIPALEWVRRPLAVGALVLATAPRGAVWALAE
ncbi:MAG: ABC transporter ATP-binding protein [Chloroflexi bacterium]|nr:ABC transporter ATP-binding protein [Chloroflexota bacterium]